MHTQNRLTLFFLTVLSLGSFSHVLGQFHDAQWVIGYDTSTNDLIGDAIQLDFTKSNLDIFSIRPPSLFWMEPANTSMSDQGGKLLFYSNACEVINQEHQIMANGDSINPGQIERLFCYNGGSPHIQGILSLPQPGNDSIYYIFNLNDEYVYQTPDWYRTPTKVFAQTIDMSKQNGLGEVIKKNQEVLVDTFSRGNLSATRHQNGKDWWVIVPKSHSNCYWLYTVTNTGIGQPEKRCVGIPFPDRDWGVQTVFTPDGRYYIRYDGFKGIHLFKFDAGSGDLYDPAFIPMLNDTTYGFCGATVSSNSRFLYISAYRRVYQFDLFAPDIAASKVILGVFDGFANPFPLVFSLAALAPDNKIYISGTSSHLNLHVIHKPDCPGLKCEFQQHGIVLPTWSHYSIPNLPHYRNQPSNVNCDSVYVSLHEPPEIGKINAFPNPTSQTITLDLNGVRGTANNYQIVVLNAQGQVKLELITNNTEPELNFAGLETGVYWVKIILDQQVYWSKVIRS
jgi:Secretion system C-terminal sorting domain